MKTSTDKQRLDTTETSEAGLLTTITSIAGVREFVRSARRDGKMIALVPTMGYLHEGHAALVDAARRDNDIVIASLFVNPLQFGPNEDYDAYPRDEVRDKKLLTEHGCNLLFAPSVKEMYPEPMATTVELPELARVLCGKSRPTHFAGVTTVVSKLFHIVQPDNAYFGQKDGQQAAIIRKMVRDLNIPVSVISVPTVREADGLAKSSRNAYLTDEQRMHAPVLYRALTAARQLLEQGERDTRRLKDTMQHIIAKEPEVNLDYAEVVRLSNLQSIGHAEGEIMLAVAAYVGKARLIDNFQLNVGSNDVTNLYK
ncbi:pantoate--beta-alanine ligase [Alicyclobacillus sp. SO9]|uniref:pantoate--beta-alanine ligase n=1 Tax=Alicyclobacillus sp. SO9 TaxID=2665646 RepID=UPI0018E880EA|nr:pantoate--beta-alanine ligase [Alicyclobacillus sp. SO9]QQE78632.1 pantoate--beta-alanine ligase [Alicyclobacillus sp. SO9]